MKPGESSRFETFNGYLDGKGFDKFGVTEANRGEFNKGLETAKKLEGGEEKKRLIARIQGYLDALNSKPGRVNLN